MGETQVGPAQPGSSSSLRQRGFSEVGRAAWGTFAT